MTFSPRRSARLRQRSENSEALYDTDTEEKRALPSTSTSGSFEERLRQQPQISAKVDPHLVAKQQQVTQTKTRRRTRQEESNSGRSFKRQRTGTVAGRESGGRAGTPAAKSTERQIPEPIEDGSPTVPSTEPRPTSANCGGSEQGVCQPIAHWAITGRWPKDFSTMDPGSDSSRKRERSSSYTEQTKNGEVPRADTTPFEKHLASHGIVMDEVEGEISLSPASRKLCEKILESRFEDPTYTQFPLSQFVLIWRRLSTRNEYRVTRDITPLLVPSPELLFLCGHPELEHIAEEISADWTKAKSLAGPKPRPDFAFGIAESAFTEEEITKLKNYSSLENPTQFTNHMYFPFLVCEAKSGEQVIYRADRQCIRSCSIAVNAIIQLIRGAGGDEISKLNGQILVFSVSHTYEQVKIYGHFAVMKGAQVTFYRYRVQLLSLGSGGDARNWKKTYDFVRGLYSTFYPEHLMRIQNALRRMNKPQARSIAPSMSTDNSQLQGEVPLSSEQTSTEFRKPNAPASKKQREQLAQQEEWYRERLQEQKAQQEKQYAEQEKRYAEQEKRYAEQEKRYAEQEKRYAEDKAQQREQLEMLKRLLNQK